MKKRVKKRLSWIFGIIIILFIALHFALEPVALHYVNKALGDLEGYQGHVKKIHIHLYRGAYRIDSLDIEKIEGDFPEPFFSVSAIDLSVEWKALFHGAVVGEIILESPRINFTKSPSGKVQAGENEDWLETIDKLIPIRINRFEIQNGEIHYIDLSTDPRVDVQIHDLNALAANLSTVREKNKLLPSDISASALTSGGGTLGITMGLNALKEIPDFDADLSIEHMDLTYFKDFTNAYAHFTFKEGNMDIFSEAAMKDGKYTGYVKPILTNIQVIDLKNEEATFWRKAWEVIVGGALKIFENKKEEQVATEVPFHGSIQNTEVGILATVLNVIKNAFIQAFEAQIDEKISLEDVDKEKEKKGIFDFLKKDREKE